MTPSKIIDVIKRHKHFLVTTHVNPDPDALASQIVLCLFLKSLGKMVRSINAEDVPKRYRFLSESKLVKGLKDQRDFFEVVIVVDCGDLNRIGAVNNLIREESVIVNIDHHITNDKFGDYNWVIPEASSTSEIIFDLLRYAQFPLSKKMAILLYIGIMTDTGSFRYDNTNAYTHKVVSELMHFNFSISEIYKKLYESLSLKDLQLLTKVVNSFDSFYGGRVVCIELSQDVLKEFSGEFDLRDKIFQHLRALKGVEVLVILTEQTKNKTRINLRSQGRFNVAELASYFNGGGHRKASGGVLPLNMKETKKRLLKKIRGILKNQ